MKDLRTTSAKLVILLGAHLLVAPFFVTPLRIEHSAIRSKEVISLYGNRGVVLISDITAEANDKIIKSPLITYQSIKSNEITADKADNWRLYEFSANGFDDANAIFLTSTRSSDSCSQNSTLPAWKIDEPASEGKFRLQLNHATQFAGETFYLCVSNERFGNFKHLGTSSRFHVGR